MEELNKLFPSKETSTTNPELDKLSKKEPLTDLQKWRLELDLAEKRGFFKRQEETNSADWACCSVGARLGIENPSFRDHIKDMSEQNDYMRKKLTPKAFALGIYFWKAVENDEPAKAKEIFEKIQRLPNLLREEGKHYVNWRFWL